MLMMQKVNDEARRMTDMQDEIIGLTHKWCADLRGKDGRVGVGACLNVLTTIGNHSPEDVKRATAMFLRKLADELEKGTPNAAQQH